MGNQFYKGKKTVSSPDDLPPGRHYVILKFGSITIPGDERSRTAPGHGYSEHTETTIDCVVFEHRDAWELEVRRLSVDYMDRGTHLPLIVNRPAVKMTISVESE